jgi:hypothetical protein
MVPPLSDNPSGSGSGDGPIVPLADARERIIEELSQHFAHDNLSLEELEHRLELAYRSSTLVELRALIADLSPQPGQAAPIAAVAASRGAGVADVDRLVAVLGETRREGVWAVPQRLDVYAVMSSVTIDLTRAVLPTGIIDIRLRAAWGAVKLVTPPGSHVVNAASAIMASVSASDDEPASGAQGSRNSLVIRVSGFVVMSELKITTRRVEE